MKDSEWPHACYMRLIELVSTSPVPKYRVIGEIIAAMPEAKAVGLLVTKEAVCGKVWRWRRKTGQAAPVSPRKRNSRSYIMQAAK